MSASSRSTPFSVSRWVLIASFVLTSTYVAAQAKPQSPTVKTEVKKVAAKKLTYEIQPPPANFSPPVLSILEPVYKWGSVLRGEVVTHSFTIRNTGNLPLRVERVKPSCGCTMVNFDKLIAPAQTGQLTLKIDTKRFTGKVKKYASIYSNASRDPYKVTMEGEIENPMTLDPKIPRIDFVRGTKPEPLDIMVRRNTQKDIKFKGASVEEKKRDILTATFEEVEPGELYRLRVTPSVPEGATKYHTVNVNVQLSIAGKDLDIPVRVSIRVRDRIEAVPASFYFTRRDTEKLKEEDAAPISKSTLIKTLDPGHSFQVTGVKVLGSTFNAKMETVKEGKEYRVTVTLPKLPAEDTRRVSEKVVVSTTDELLPQLTLNATASLAYKGSATRRPFTPRRPGTATTTRTPSGPTSARGVRPSPIRTTTAPRRPTTTTRTPTAREASKTTTPAEKK